ncbi:MAG: DUF4836 family protein [Chitinophagaceae bacterium]|nr:MAG: DUF4836 family protein [Chitinophagaceae bacterium]
MKRNVFFIAVMAVFSVIAVSCGRGDKSGLAIPKDASVVVHINSGGLTKKISWEEIKGTNWFREIYAEADDSLAKKMMDDPGASGIDIDKDLAFFAKRQGRGGYMVFEGFVKDAAAFEAFNKKINDGATASKSGDLNIMKLKENGMLSWNASRFVYVLNAPNMGGFAMMSQGAPTEPYSFPADSLQMFGTLLYDLPSDQSMYEDDRFAAVMKESGDMHVWMNNEKTYGSMAEGMLSMLKVNALFDKNATGMSVNFDDGKISVKSKQFFNKDVLKLLDKYPAKDISADLINRIPSQNVVAAIVMNYPPEGLKELMKLFGFDGAINGFMQQVGYSVDEFVKANKGEILIAVTDLKPYKGLDSATINPDGTVNSQNSMAPDLNYFFATSINDKPAFDKLVGIIAGQVGDISQSGGFPKLSYSMNNNWFAAGNSQEQVTRFLAGGDNKQPFASKITGQPFGAYVDLQKIMASGTSAATDTSSKAALDLSLKMWQDITVTGGKLKSGSLNYDVEINLVNKSANSLKQLNQYADQMSLTKKKKAF